MTKSRLVKLIGSERTFSLKQEASVVEPVYFFNQVRHKKDGKRFSRTTTHLIFLNNFAETNKLNISKLQ